MPQGRREHGPAAHRWPGMAIWIVSVLALLFSAFG
jgi:hypothetical protein